MYKSKRYMIQKMIDELFMQCKLRKESASSSSSTTAAAATTTTTTHVPINTSKAVKGKDRRRKISADGHPSIHPSIHHSVHSTRLEA